MTFPIATRNLYRRKKNSLLLILLFSVITALFYTGNALMAESGRGMKKSFIDNFTSHLVIKAPTEMEVGLFGATTPSIGEYYALPELKDRQRLEELILKRSSVQAVTPLIYGACAMDVAGNRYTIPVFGVEGQGYFDFFPGLHVIKGAPLQKGKTGVMITLSRYEQIKQESSKALSIGDPVLLSMYGNGGFKIREVPLVGVFAYEQSNPQLEEMVLSDLQTIRALNSLSLAHESIQEIEQSEADLLGGDPDDLFHRERFFDAPPDQVGQKVSTRDVANIIDSVNPEQFEEGGSCHFLLVRLKDGGRIGSVSRDLKNQIQQAGLEAEIIRWRQAAGLSAQMIFLLQILYNAGFLLVAIAGCIALVNILLISVFDRTGEIGTLRAVGARKKYVEKLILTENLLLAGIGAVLGIFLGQVFLFYINSLKLPVTNSMLQSLLGRNILFVAMSPLWWGISLGVTLILGWAASLYPVSRALLIQPVTAQSRG